MIKNKIYILSIMFLFVLKTYGLEERNWLTTNQSPEKIVSSLVMNQKWVRYPAYTDRAGWDKLLGENKSLYIDRGVSRLKYEWRVIKATDYLDYERTGNRFSMQNISSANNNALADLVIAELAEGKGRFMDQIINGVFYTCERTSWTLSAHLNRQSTKRVIPIDNENVVALVSAETAAFLSWTYYFFHSEFDKTDPEISQRLYNEIYKKVIVPYRTDNSFWWMGIGFPKDTQFNNWNPWCNANVLQCCMLLEKDSVQLSKDVYRSMQSVDRFINYVGADGACEEGPSYWEHAAGKLYDYLLVLNWITNSKVSLFDNNLIRKMGEYISRTYVGNDWVVNFADASAKFSAKGSLVYRYGKAVNSQEMMHFAAYLEKESISTVTYGVDFLRVLESIYYDKEIKQTTIKHEIADVTIYPETQFYYFKNKQNFFLATKGGYNAESHNHNDAGSFSLWLENTPIFIDAGVGTYTRQTFGPERYTIWTMRSNHHNLPTINGCEEQFGKGYKTTDIKVDEKKKMVSFDIATTYPTSAKIVNWRRSYQLTDKELLVKDVFNINNPEKPNKIHFMLWGKVEKMPGVVKIMVENKNVELLYDNKQFNSNVDTIILTDSRLSRVWGKEIYRLTLTAKQIPEKGVYNYKIRKL